MQSMKRAASGAKAARKKVRTTAASGARAARKKVRTQVHGCRVWVWPCDKENVEVALKQKRDGKKSWTAAEAVKTCVDQEMKTNWHGRAPGASVATMGSDDEWPTKDLIDDDAIVALISDDDMWSHWEWRFGA